MQKAYPRELRWLLRLDWKAKSIEQSANGKNGDFFLHLFFHISTARHLTLAPSHLITLSARNSTDCGIVTPICLAVLRLMTNSNLIGRSTAPSSLPLSTPHSRLR